MKCQGLGLGFGNSLKLYRLKEKRRKQGVIQNKEEQV